MHPEKGYRKDTPVTAALLIGSATSLYNQCYGIVNMNTHVCEVWRWKIEHEGTAAFCWAVPRGCCQKVECYAERCEQMGKRQREALPEIPYKARKAVQMHG